MNVRSASQCNQCPRHWFHTKEGTTVKPVYILVSLCSSRRRETAVASSEKSNDHAMQRSTAVTIISVTHLEWRQRLRSSKKEAQTTTEQMRRTETNIPLEKRRVREWSQSLSLSFLWDLGTKGREGLSIYSKWIYPRIFDTVFLSIPEKDTQEQIPVFVTNFVNQVCLEQRLSSLINKALFFSNFLTHRLTLKGKSVKSELRSGVCCQVNTCVWVGMREKMTIKRL
jgi:hypothetical protein